MTEKLKKICQLVVLALLLGTPSVGLARPVEIMPLSRIKPGMTGYGLTVFYGFKIERFNVRVIDVLKNFLPRQDLFLVHVDHPRVRKTGVVGGMSGSPIYLEGKLAGALAYGWRFASEPVAGITPIQPMLDLLKRKPRGPQGAGYAMAPLPRRTLQRLAAASDSRRVDPRGWRLPFPVPTAPTQGMMAPVTVPLAMAGFAGESMTLLRDAFASYGFEPVQGGGTGKVEGPAGYEAGGAIGIQMVSGDMSLTGTGTVTWVGPGKGKVLAFGHRMFNAGEIYIQAMTARINHTMASLSRSFKLSSPARVIGSLVQDRQAGILVDPARTIGVVPMTVTMRSRGQTHVFRTRLAHHRLLTPTLATTVFASALAEAMADVTHATMKVTSRFTVKGYPQVQIVDHMYASTGPRLTAVLFSRGLRELRRVLDNPFGPAYIERIDLDVDVLFDNAVVEITGVRVNSTTVDPGDRINLQVSFRPYSGGEFTKVYPLQIPRSMAGSLLVAEVSSGDRVRPDLAEPENLGQLLQNVQEGYSARSLVVGLKVPTDGVKIRGRVIRDLPVSVIDALNTGTQTRSEQLFQTVIRHIHGTSRLVSGQKQIRIRVRPNEVNP